MNNVLRTTTPAGAVAAVLATVFAASTPPAHASTMYDYIVQPQGGSITPGKANTLNVYLQEVTTGGTSFTAAGDTGLLSGGAAVVNGGTGVTFTAAAANDAASPPAGFAGGFNAAGVVNNNAGAWVFNSLGFGTTSTGVMPAVTTVANGTTTSLYLLGTVTINVATNPNAVLTVESMHDSPAGFQNSGTDGNTLTHSSFYDLDGNANADEAPGITGADGRPTTFAVTGSPLPEPAATAIVGLGAAALLARRRRCPAEP